MLAFGEGQSGILKNVLHGQLRWEPFPQDHTFEQPVMDAVILDADSNFSWDVVTISDQKGNGDPQAHPVLTTTTNPDAAALRGDVRRVLIHTGPRTTASAWCTPILKDFLSRRSFVSLRARPSVSIPTRRLSTPPFDSALTTLV